MMPHHLSSLPFQETLKLLEADIKHANALAAAIPRSKGETVLKMKLTQNDGGSNISSRGRKATIREFYAVILASLQRLSNSLENKEIDKEGKTGLEGSSFGKEMIQGDRKLINVDSEREDECGICLEPCTKVVLPSCCHAMCIKCYRKWNTRSESCPFCRGSLRRVNSGDLWILTCNEDVVDAETVWKEDLLRFYLYINSLPKDHPDALFLMYYEHLM